MTAGRSFQNDLTRKSFLAGAGSFLLLGAASCNGSPEQKSDSSGDTRVIRHKYGRTEISGTPTRIVSVGFIDQDPILALGTVPLAMGRWIENKAVWPWNENELNGEKPEIITPGEPNFEEVAALEPDLIIGLSSGMTQDTYDTLSEIAPTIDHSAEYVDFGTPWQEFTRVVGKAMNRSNVAEGLIADIEAAFEDVRQENPEFKDKRAVVALGGDNGTYYPYGDQDPRSRFMSSLGFETSSEVNELAGDQFFASITEERFDLLDEDLLIWLIQNPEQEQNIKDSEIYQQLDVVQREQDLFFRLSDSEPIVAAFSFGSVLSLPYLLENFVPQLATALSGEVTSEA